MYAKYVFQMSKTSDGATSGFFDTLEVTETTQEATTTIGTPAINKNLTVNGNIILTGTISGGGGGIGNASTLTGKTWEAPGTIGSTTPNTGAFTTLAATQNVAGTSYVSNTNPNTNGIPGYKMTSDVGSEMTVDVTGSTTATPGRGRIRTSAAAFGLDMDAQGASKSIRLMSNTVERINIQDASITLTSQDITLSAIGLGTVINIGQVTTSITNLNGDVVTLTGAASISVLATTAVLIGISNITVSLIVTGRTTTVEGSLAAHITSPLLVNVGLFTTTATNVRGSTITIGDAVNTGTVNVIASTTSIYGSTVATIGSNNTVNCGYTTTTNTNVYGVDITVGQLAPIPTVNTIVRGALTATLFSPVATYVGGGLLPGYSTATYVDGIDVVITGHNPLAGGGVTIKAAGALGGVYIGTLLPATTAFVNIVAIGAVTVTAGGLATFSGAGQISIFCTVDPAVGFFVNGVIGARIFPGVVTRLDVQGAGLLVSGDSTTTKLLYVQDVAGTTPLQVSSSITTGLHMASFLQASLASPAQSFITIGKAAAPYLSAVVEFGYIDAITPINNLVRIGPYGGSYMTISGAGNTTVNGNLTVTGTITGPGTVPWATPGTIGSTTPNTGAFTTLSATAFSIDSTISSIQLLRSALPDGFPFILRLGKTNLSPNGMDIIYTHVTNGKYNPNPRFRGQLWISWCKWISCIDF